MTTSVYRNRKMAKASFFAAYALSILLILVLFSSFLKPAVLRFSETDSDMKQKADPHSAIYQLLHRRMEGLDHVCAKVANDKSAANLSLLQKEAGSFYAGLDSVRRAMSLLPDAGKERELSALLDAFSRAAEKQVNLAKGVAATDESPGNSQELAHQLQQKDQRILELETQNQVLSQEKEKALAELQDRTNAPVQLVQQTTESGAAAWKEKYERLKQTADKLKASNDNFSLQANALRKSYKEVVEDNRRLLAQLQAARAGKN